MPRISEVFASLAGHAAPVTCFRLTDQAEYLNPQAQNGRSVRARLAYEAIKLPLPQSYTGLCSGCNKFVGLELSARHANFDGNSGSINISFSETSVCPNCKISSRMRFAVDVLDAARVSGTAKVYCAEQGTHLHRCLVDKGWDITGSEYLGPEKSAGQMYGGIRHEDLSSLSFEDESFDFAICLDVVEHMSNPVKAIGELYRVLKKDGLGIITFPFHASLRHSVIRARDVDGATQKYMTEIFHTAPHGNKSLVYTDFGWDFVQDVLSGFNGCAFIDYWSPIRGHLGPFRPALIIAKQA